MLFTFDVLNPIVGKEFKLEIAEETKPEKKRYEPITDYTIRNEENFVEQLYNNWASDMQSNGYYFPLHLSNTIFQEQETLLNAILNEEHPIFPSRKELFMPPRNIQDYIPTSVGVVNTRFLNSIAYHLNFFTMFFSMNYPKTIMLRHIYEEGLAKYVSVVKMGATGDTASLQFSYVFRVITLDILNFQKILLAAVRKNLPLEKLYALLTKYYRLEKIDYRYEMFIISILSAIVTLKQKKLEENLNDGLLDDLTMNLSLALTSYYSLLDAYTQEEAKQNENFYHIIAKDKNFIQELEKKYMSYYFENIVRKENGRNDNEFMLYGFMYASDPATFEELKKSLVAESLALDDKNVDNVTASDDLLAILFDKAILSK